ncbi:hypothetical protein CTI12_AA183010 [Artemisia annua]|uniref:Uncharacterized protein n=1 Tax=Artemisia annua TaxID=35608 RepID=A0A2U1P7Z0_ARTAN|nr:hypothetical protein CTI12_AA183010 [Artemisia annua]
MTWRYPSDVTVVLGDIFRQPGELRMTWRQAEYVDAATVVVTEEVEQLDRSDLAVTLWRRFYRRWWC